MKEEDKYWDVIIEADKFKPSLNLKEIWKYRDLIGILIKRDITTVYKQTILGPVWYVIQALLTSVAFTLIFGNILNISSDGIPHLLFYMSGVIIWNFFATSLTRTSNIFAANATLFDKVYFPRLCVPISSIATNLLSLGIQLLTFAFILAYYLIFQRTAVHVHAEYLLLIPFLLIMIVLMSLGLGTLVSSLTAKYRDLTFLVGFGLQLLIYASPVIFPLSAVKGKLRIVLELNPMTSVIETFKYATLGVGNVSVPQLLYSVIFSVVIFITGLFVFNYKEKSFIDTV
jgi:lipopolysaccharide transport system permease protein